MIYYRLGNTKVVKTYDINKDACLRFALFNTLYTIKHSGIVHGIFCHFGRLEDNNDTKNFLAYDLF